MLKDFLTATWLEKKMAKNSSFMVREAFEDFIKFPKKKSSIFGGARESDFFKYDDETFDICWIRIYLEHCFIITPDTAGKIDSLSNWWLRRAAMSWVIGQARGKGERCFN